MKARKTLTLVWASIALVAFLFSCSKNDQPATNEKAHLQVFLTDGPGDFEAVYIDVQDIKVNYSSDSANGWQSLNGVRRGTYDLLKLTNGKDTLLADAELNSGKIEQIRLILGSENYVQVDGNKIKLETPSAQQSGLKLNVHQEVNGGILYKVVLDFDAAKSIHRTGNGKYMLKPVIRTLLEAMGGGIKGFVLPDSVKTAVLALKGSDTIASTYTLNGGYWLKGVEAGSYDLHFLPSDTNYKSQVKSAIAVTVDKVTTVDTVKLVK